MTRVETIGRCLPPESGKFCTLFYNWVKADVFLRLFLAVSDDADMEYAMVDGTIDKVHRRGQGAKGGRKIRP